MALDLNWLSNVKFPVGFGWWVSIVLNKGPYSHALNPHIGVYRPQRGGYMLCFDPDRPVFNIELDGRKRAFRKRLHKAS